jgi:hypothetical protein
VVVYNRPWCVYTTPRSAPLESERTEPFGCQATPGELEPIGVSVYCLSDVAKIKGNLSELKGPGTIPASAASVYSVYQIPMPWDWSGALRDPRRQRLWDRVPNLLLDLPEGLPGKARESRQLVFDLEIPLDARPGKYTGTITIETEKGKVGRPVMVTVLPFKLDPCHEEWQRGMFGIPRNLQDARFQIKWGLNSFAAWWVDASVLFGTTHGLCNANGDLVLAKAGRDRMLGPVLAMAREAGFRHWVYFLMDGGFGNAVKAWWGTKPYPSDEYASAYKKTVQALLRACKDAGYPEPILVANDEPTNRARGYDTARILDEMKWIDEVGGKNYTVVFQKSDPKEFAGKAYLQLWVSNNPSPEKSCAAQANGCRLGTYRGGHWQRKVAEGPHKHQDLPAWADPWTYCQAVQTVDHHRPVFLDRWRQETISETLRLGLANQANK